MSTVLVVVLLLCAGLAAANGANDVSKGVATLAGAGVARYRSAIVWGVLATLLGAAASLTLAGSIGTLFTSGVVGGSPSPRFAAAVLGGAMSWVVVATAARLPVSTTHAILGALLGAGLVAGPAAVHWDSVIGKAVVPLLASIAVAYALSAALARIAGHSPECVCVEVAPIAPVTAAGSGAAVATMHAARVAVVTGSAGACAIHAGGVQRVGVSVDMLHWLSSGATSFARGLNDTPKIWAIGAFALVPGTLSRGQLLAVIAVAMAAGGAFAGVRVARQLGDRVVAMSHREGCAANATTALLVGGAAHLGMPVSTTHVSTGAIAGVAGGDVARLNTRTVRGFLLAWTVTPAIAGLVAAAAYGGIR